MFSKRRAVQALALVGVCTLAVMSAVLIGPGREVTARSNAGGPEITPLPGRRTPTAEQVAMARAPLARQPVRSAYPTRNAADVVANLQNDPFYQRLLSSSAAPGPLYDPRVANGQLGAPALVRALKPGEQDGWLVPIVSSGVPVGVISVSIRSDGTGHATSFRGWPYPTVPAISEARARLQGAIRGDSVADVELVWADGLGRPSDILSPFWRIRRVSGTEVFLFEDGQLLPSSAIRR